MASSADMENHQSTVVDFRSYITVKPYIRDKEGSIYNIWKEQMVSLIDSNGLLGVVNGEITPGDEEDDELSITRDRLVKGWILGSIGEDARGAVEELTTARNVWLELEKIFAQDNNIDSISVFSSVHYEKPNGAGEDETSGSEFFLPVRRKTTHTDGPRLRKSHLQKWVPPEGENVNVSEMYRAALRGDWVTAEELFKGDDHKERSKGIISARLETPLHVAVGTAKANNFVEKLLKLWPGDEAVLLAKDYQGDTALHYAARVGNKEAAIMLVDRKPDLLYITNSSDRLPVQIAAIHCQKETLTYLIQRSKPHVQNSPFAGDLGVRLLKAVTASEFFDVALELVNKYPDLARSSGDSSVDDSALSTIARMTSAFKGGESFSRWHNLIYSCIPMESSTGRSKRTVSTASDIENHMDAPGGTKSSCFTIYIAVSLQKLRDVISKVVQYLVPQVKSIGCKKVMQQQALELVKSLCEKTGSLPYDKASAIFDKSIILAAEYGIHEVVQVIAENSPTSVFAEDPKTGRNIFSMAARNRHENVFNLIYDMSDRKYNFYDSVDEDNNSLMHLCAKIAPSHKLNLVPGAALQMQRELQWFKEMKKFVHPSRREWPNDDEDTPIMLFSKEHLQLKADGETWMRSTANSCSIAAALIATVVFAAAFTVPGGVSSESGDPIYHNRFTFLLFAVSDAVSLFTSLTSLLMFLSILTSRYAEEDFLYVLPKRLSIGLFTLFVSVTFMMAAFGATLYLMLVKEDPRLLFLVAALACLPVASFALLQFPLLLDVVYSTYGPGIFGKKTGHLLY